MSTKVWLLSILILTLIFLSGCELLNMEIPLVLLEFPFEDPSTIVRMAAFNIPDWGEPGVYHNGIDLIIDTPDEPQLLENPVKLIAPASGRISSVTVDENPYNPECVIFGIIISINKDMTVILALEPMLGEGEDAEDQLNLITVEKNQMVTTGEEVAWLIDGKREYSHLHYMVEYKGEIVSPYDYSTPEAKIVFDEISLRTGEPVNYPENQVRFNGSPK